MHRPAPERGFVVTALWRTMVGDIMQGDPVGELLAGEKADIVYSDPPWGQGNVTYWRTQNGERQTTDWAPFLKRFCALASAHLKPDGHLFVEMGLRWVDDLAATMALLGRAERARWRCVYGSPKLPNALWYSGPGEPVDVSGMGGFAMTKKALAAVAFPNALVLDPCCGKGMTARAALRLGMRFYGNELNPARLAVTESWCRKLEAR